MVATKNRTKKPAEPATPTPADKPVAEGQQKAWGAFTTDTAGGTLPLNPQPGEFDKPQEPLVPAEDTEAAKVKTARGKAASKAPAAAGANDPAINTTELVKFVERIERAQEEIAAMKGDLKELFVEVKAKGYKSAILRKVLARRAMDDDKRKEIDSMIALYEEALR